MSQPMLADTDFQTDYDTQADELKKLRKKIKNGTTPDWIITALGEMHAEFPEGTSLRYRSSTNNEDLPGFSGAGLYDSKTQDPEETEEDGIDKSIKGVWESLWNFRAFVERDFHRVDHLNTAMGVLVHPNYSDELANGVAVSYDPFGDRDDVYYVNTQVGEDLVTNPEAFSFPEEILLGPVVGTTWPQTILSLSNQVADGDRLMTEAQYSQLGQHLTGIHDHFKRLYDPDGSFAMEIEFKITSDNVLAIKQARPWVFRPLNEPPRFPSTETGVRQVAEGVPEGTHFDVPVAATDPDGDALTYTLSGPDDDLFEVVRESGLLLTRTLLDYGARETYSVIVRVHDGKDRKGRPSVATDDWVRISITVINADEEGTLTLSSQQPKVGRALTATLSDPDGGVSSLTFTWERSENGGSWKTISLASGRSYTPVDSDLNHHLRVTAFYADSQGSGKSALWVSTNPVDEPSSPPIATGGGGVGFGPAPVAPKFSDGFRTTRAVAENARAGDAVGEAVSATHPDELEITYSINGADASLFTVDEETGQISVREGVELPLGTTYTVNLTATDSAGFGAIIIVMIEVTEATHHPYDLNRNGQIERDEIIRAVEDYFDGEITKDDVIDLIRLYFAEPG